jgi:hypothetical protein
VVATKVSMPEKQTVKQQDSMKMAYGTAVYTARTALLQLPTSIRNTSAKYSQ